MRPCPRLLTLWCTEYGEDVMYFIGAIAVSRQGLHEATINEFIAFVEKIKGVKLVKLSTMYEVLRVPLEAA